MKPRRPFFDALPPLQGPSRRTLDKIARTRGLVGALTLDDLDPPDEGSDEDPDDALFRHGFLEVDLES